MAKQRQTSPSNNSPHKRTSFKYLNPFYVIYNHRRILRARALKKIKQAKRKVERILLQSQKQIEKQQNFRSWNASMLGDDSVWENVCDTIKKQEKQSDQTMIRAQVYDQKLAMVRVSILEYYPMVEKRSLFQDKFVTFDALITPTQVQAGTLEAVHQ